MSMIVPPATAFPVQSVRRLALPDGGRRQLVSQAVGAWSSASRFCVRCVEARLPLRSKHCARLLERGGCLVGASGKHQYFAEVGVGVPELGRLVGPFGERGRLARETFGLLRLSATCEHFCPYLPPEHLRDDVVARAERCGTSCPDVGLVESVERIQRLRELAGRGRKNASFSQLLELSAPFAAELGGGGGISRQELDLEGRASGRISQFHPSSAFCQPRSAFGEDRARLVEATKHREHL